MITSVVPAERYRSVISRLRELNFPFPCGSPPRPNQPLAFEAMARCLEEREGSNSPVVPVRRAA